MKSEAGFAYRLLSPGLALLFILIGYPMMYNLYISVFKVPLNPTKPSTFIGAENFMETLTDSDFYISLGTSVKFTALVTILSTFLALLVALLLNREFIGKKFVNALVISSYVIPAISLIYTVKYMFNSVYGVINYFVVYVLHLTDTPPMWFDSDRLSFAVVIVFFVWRYFPYAYMSLSAALKTIDNTLYEASVLDGANKWEQFKAVTFPEIKPVLATVISLRTIWSFYTYADLRMLTSRVRTIGVYLYDTAFSSYDFGKAASISILLFGFIFTVLILIRRRIFKEDEG